MPTKVYPFESEIGTIYIETEEQPFDKSIFEQKKVEEDGIITVSKKSATKLVVAGGGKFEESLGVLEHISKSVLSKVSKVNATEITLEMGLKFDGELGIPFIARCASEANFKVTVTWKGQKTKDYDVQQVPKES